MRSILYRFPDLEQFERMMSGAGEGAELEFGIPSSESVDDGEWILAIFELGAGRRATSAAGRAAVSPDGSRLVFEPRDWRRLSDFAERARAAPPAPPSEPSGGPRVSSEVPASRPSNAPETARSPAAPRPPRPSGAGARVMIVDDDPDIRDVVSAMLEAVGLHVVPVGSAEEALDRVSTEPFDLLVLDWNLPKMTGLDLCRTIRRDPALGLLPVLFLTANASSQDMVEAFACGGDDYVVKPFRAPELGARIFSLLRRSRMTAG